MTVGRPLLSVVIPAIQVDLELRRCIDSVRLACGSDPGHCEIVLVTPQRLTDAARLLVGDGGVHVAETRRGIYAAMNDGIRASRGKYLFFLGKDDIVLPPFGKMIEQIAQQGGSAAFCDVYWGKEGLYSGRPSRWQVLRRNFCHQGIVYAREVIDAHGPYLRRLRVQADHLLNIRLLWDPRFMATIRYFPGGHVWYAAEGFSAVARDPLFRRLYPAIIRRYVGGVAAVFLLASRTVRGKR